MSEPNVNKISKKERTIKKILRVSEKLIKEKGYAKVSNNEIAKKSGVSIGLLYKYFRIPEFDPKLIKQTALLIGKPVIIHELIKNSRFVRGFTNFSFSLKKEEIMSDFESIQKLSGAGVREKITNFFIFFIDFHEKKEKIIRALEIAYLSENEIFKNFDLDYFYKDIIDTLSRLLIFIGLENDKELSKFLFNMFNNIIVRHVIFGKITDTNEKLAGDLADVFISYVKSKSEEKIFDK